MTSTRLKHWAAFLFPALVSLYLYRRSFRIWFLNDDFAWLGLRLGIHAPSDLWAALFAPMAQGTVRTLSERLFFLAFEQNFGLESLPMRLFAFATFAVAQVLLVVLVRRLTGSLSTGMLASILWSLNFGTTVAMSWLSSYNQVLVAALFLGATTAFIHSIDTSSGKWRAVAWACYVAGFGALETIVVLPAVLLVWALWFERKAVRAVLPMFVPAIAFSLAHLYLIPKDRTATAYKMHFDASLIESIGIYWNWLLASVRLLDFNPEFAWMVTVSTWVLSPALIAFVIWRTMRKDWLPLFSLVLTAALIAPMLPLRDHRTDYYLGSASMGFAILLALVPLRIPKPAAVGAIALLSIYIVPSFILQQATFEWYLERTAPLRPLMRGLTHAATIHPGKLLVVDGVTDAVYYSSFSDDAMRLIPGAEVRLAPGSGPKGNPFELPPASLRAALEKQTMLIYQFDGTILRDVTRQWEASPNMLDLSALPPEVLAGDPGFSKQFGPGWYDPEGTGRWMSQRGTVELGTPSPAAGILRVEAYAPKEMQTFQLEVAIDGAVVHKSQHAAGTVEFEVKLPPGATSKPAVKLEFRASKQVQVAGDNRSLSLLVSRIALR